MSLWCQSGWRTRIRYPHISWRMETLWSIVCLLAKKLWIHKENVRVAGTEPFSLLLLPKMDRNKCLSDGARLSLAVVTNRVEAAIWDSPLWKLYRGAGFTWTQGSVVLWVEIHPPGRMKQMCNCFWAVAFYCPSKKWMHLCIRVEFGIEIESW